MMEKEKRLKKRGKGVFSDFKNFAFKEATLGAAVGIMLGGAFKDVINSLVNDILTPPIAHITSGIDFSSMYFVFGGDRYGSINLAREAGAVVIHYGNFISEFISFVITAFILFIIVYESTKLMNMMQRKEEVKEKRKKKVCPYCMSEVDEGASRCAFCTSRLKV